MKELWKDEAWASSRLGQIFAPILAGVCSKEARSYGALGKFQWWGDRGRSSVMVEEEQVGSWRQFIWATSWCSRTTHVTQWHLITCN